MVTIADVSVVEGVTENFALEITTQQLPPVAW